MKVIAIKSAFFNGTRVHVGDELEVPETLKASWFTSAEAVAPAPVKSKASPKTLSQAGKEEGKSFIEANKTPLA